MAALLASLLVAGPSAAQTVEVLAIDPPAARLLGVRQSLDVQIRYDAEQPVRFQASGYYHGDERRAGRRTNPAPLYPAGQGEAVVWLEYTEAAEIDELRIQVSNRTWQQLSEVSLPMTVEWRPGAAAAAQPRAAWVARLNDAQQQMVSSAAPPDDPVGDWLWTMLFMFAGWSVPGYFVLQAVLYRRWEGSWRLAARLPLVATVPIFGYTLLALAAGSNLWPLVMLFTFPFAFLYLAGLVAVRRFSAATPSRRR